MRDFLLISIGLIAVFLLIVMWVWYIIFGKSLRKMVFTMLGVVLDKDRLVDPEAEIIPNLERHASDDLLDTAAHVKADIPLAGQPLPQQARVPQYERGQLAQNTSDNGWPRELSYEERHEPRPFLNANLQTETEIYEPPQQLVQRSEILDVENPIVQPVQPVQPPMDVENPIVQPVQPPMDVEIPNIPHVDTSDNKSDYGVRDSDISPGRMLRDKRHNRNESD
jgi:hypothetical protein